VRAGEGVPGGHVDRRQRHPGQALRAEQPEAAGQQPVQLQRGHRLAGQQRLQSLHQQRGRLQRDGAVAEHVAGAHHAGVREQVGEHER
jgi:hypothetical protein